MSSEQVDELREAIIHKLGLERTLQEQLIPSNMEDFMSDWSFTVDDILSLIARHTKEAVLKARYDELWTNIAGRKNIYASSVYKIDGQKLADRLAELEAELSAPQQSTSPDGSADRKDGDGLL